MGQEEEQTWLASPDAAARLGVTVGHVGWLGAQGHLEVRHRRGRRMVSRDSLEELEHERRRWITLVEAGRMLGVSSKTAQRLARQGRLVQRQVPGTRSPSIERQSVESYLRGLRRRPGEDA